MMNTFLETAKKPVVFMLTAAVGCFAAAVLAELFLFVTSKGAASQAVCLTIDISGSMAGDKMNEVKEAAKTFIKNRNLSRDHIAITVFSSVGKILVPFTQDKDKLFQNIDSLLSYGGTNFEDAMTYSERVVKEYSGKNDCAVLLFTDGASSVGDPQKALEIAQQLRKNGVRIFAVATQDGDMPYLAGLTGNENHVIGTQDGRFEEAFAQAEKMISESLMGGGGNYSFMELLIRTVGWTIFLSLGIALALAAIQNHFLKKPLLPAEQLILVLIGSASAALAAGSIGEISHQIFGVIRLGILGQVIGWTILGAILAFGMVYFIPNLSKTNALKFGALGGFLGSLAFLVFSIGTEIGGRLLGAFILGACIGLLVALVETLYRNVWLMVVYDLRNFAQVNLGSQNVTVGSGKSNTVLIPDALAKAGTFRTEGDKICYTDSDGKQQLLVPGNRVKIGTVELVICSKDVPFSPSKFYPMKMSKAKELQSQS
ncbi:MAG: VWA domain-containing protein [Planctomycetaceae bacterium]|jgi:Ca-activated chloride channel family protein|nr:VWA domain-containing protein [Planctomycetaceae bacterium]